VRPHIKQSERVVFFVLRDYCCASKKENRLVNKFIVEHTWTYGC